MKLSIIIVTHARPSSLARLLRSLRPQLQPGKHQLFVAENGTPIPAQIDNLGLELTHLHDPNPGKCRSQNRALAMAAGDVIAFLDDDVMAAPTYLDAVDRFFVDYPQFAAMAGRILAAKDPYAVAGAAAPYLDLPIVDKGEAVVEVRGVTGANMAFRASALRAVGPFDERLGPGASGHEEETELSQRLRRIGMKIGYAPLALVWHEVDPERAVRTRFIRIARERGYCRTLHEKHSRGEVVIKIAVAAVRLMLARAVNAPVFRIAREERRLATAQGMRDGLQKRRRIDVQRGD